MATERKTNTCPVCGRDMGPYPSYSDARGESICDYCAIEEFEAARETKAQ